MLILCVDAKKVNLEGKIFQCDPTSLYVPRGLPYVSFYLKTYWFDDGSLQTILHEVVVGHGIAYHDPIFS